MFSVCRSLQTGLILLAFSACSKQPAPPPGEPLVTAVEQQHGAQPNAPSINSHINAAGLAATYAATFEAGERLRISEQRDDSRRGDYEFRGARLLHYSGGGLSGPDAIELAFDLQGALTLSKSETGTVPAVEVSAIRERAQLLRSHALAQKSSRDHR
jgi:hypothetical protein